MLIGGKSVRSSLAAAFMLAGAHAAEAGNIHRQNEQKMPEQAGNVLLLGDVTRSLIGYVRDFCPAHMQECQYKNPKEDVISMTPHHWRVIQAVNHAVNNEIAPMEDIAQYGVAEKWTYPTSGAGDCEDYALEKRRRLEAQGFPASALLIVIVQQQNGDGHAILNVRTNKGDFALDNLASMVKPIDRTGYKLLKSIDPADASRFRTVAGVVPLLDEKTVAALQKNRFTAQLRK